jgi:D-tyrosyl-tRNA(Tyr) deacylase
MKAVIQRCKNARLIIDNKEYSSIGKGLFILLGITHDDQNIDIEWLSGKISRLRIFNDEKGKMNLSVKDIEGEILVVSQFTLFASTRKGNRPSYINSAPPEIAIPLYEKFIKQIEIDSELKVATGKFGAYMEIDFVNDGPVTIIMDSKNKE